MTLQLTQFVQGLFGKNSEPNSRTFRRDEAWSSLPLSLEDPYIIKTFKVLVKKPIHYIYLDTIFGKVLSDELIDSAISINENFLLTNTINIDFFPYQIKVLDFTEGRDQNLLLRILNSALCKSLSQAGEQRIMDLTDGKYKRIFSYGIYRSASSTLKETLNSYFLGNEDIQLCFKPLRSFRSPLAWKGCMNRYKVVDHIWSPLAVSTKAYNMTHSHFPISQLNHHPKDSYSIISLRDPIERICSFYSQVKEKFNSLDEFIDDCHPDYIAAQLYFCDQSSNLSKAKEALKKVKRVMLVEDSHNWGKSY